MSKISPSADAFEGLDAQRDGLAFLRPAKLVLAEDGHVGDALRRARESLDMAVDDIAQATHIRAAYIDAIEKLDLDPLPARPFAVGYVRAYARALGLDPDMVAARFRRETPGEDSELRTPLGWQFRRGMKFGRVTGAVALLVAAIVGWNLVVRAKAPVAHTVSLASVATVGSGPPAGPARLGAPLPAPPEATTPPPYETPGLAQATAATGSDAAAAVTARIAQEAAQSTPVNAVAPGVAFAARGPIYGAPQAETGVMLQALRPMSLVVRGPGGAVYFARQFGAGEAWRAPATPGLVADVDVPAAVEVYVQGRAIGPLTQSQTPLASLTAPKPPAR